MNTFEKRKKGFESKFAVDEETKFKIQVKANRMLGMWVANRLGLEGEAAKNYSLEVVKSDFEEAGTEDVFRKIMKDANGKIPENEVRKKAEEFYAEAERELNPAV